MAFDARHHDDDFGGSAASDADDSDEERRLRGLATGPCKQACLLLGDMAFSAYRTQLRTNIDAAGQKARDTFYDGERLRSMDRTAHAAASAAFETQLEAQLAAQQVQHSPLARDWGLATVTRCMERCIGRRDGAKVLALCECIERAGDLPQASACFNQQS